MRLAKIAIFFAL